MQLCIVRNRAAISWGIRHDTVRINVKKGPIYSVRRWWSTTAALDAGTNKYYECQHINCRSRKVHSSDGCDVFLKSGESGLLERAKHRIEKLTMTSGQTQDPVGIFGSIMASWVLDAICVHPGKRQ